MNKILLFPSRTGAGVVIEVTTACVDCTPFGCALHQSPIQQPPSNVNLSRLPNT